MDWKTTLTDQKLSNKMSTKKNINISIRPSFI